MRLKYQWDKNAIIERYYNSHYWSQKLIYKLEIDDLEQPFIQPCMW